MLNSILGVFTSIGSWMTTQISSLQSLFVTGTGDSASLTFMGILAVAGLGFSVIFLLIGLIQNFLHFRG